MFHKIFMRNHSEIAPVPTLDPVRVEKNGLQHLGFKVHTEEFLLPMSLVREIVMLPNITFAPHSAHGVEGVFSLRGEIMPVFNIRKILNFPKAQSSASTRLIIMSNDAGGFGLIVDSITEFVWLLPTDIANVDSSFFSSGYQVLSGVARVGDKMRGIVDVTKLLAPLGITAA